MVENLRYLFYGALIFQTSFMLILFLQNRKKQHYIFYSLYVLGIFLTFEPKLLGIRHAFVFLIEWPTILLYILFLESFLNISSQSKYFEKFALYLKWVVLGLLVVQLSLTCAKEFFGPMETVDDISHFFDDLFFYMIYICGGYAIYETYKLKNVLSRYILTGSSILLISVILHKLFFESVKNDGPLFAGIFLELLIFSAAIGFKTDLVESEKRKTQEQLMQTTLISLRDQMSPHFIANCLNSIKLLIQQQKEKEAIEYLTEFSKLHRLIVEHFKDTKVTLKRELTICKSYLEMEKLRFKESFNYKFDLKIEDNLLTFVEVPPLLFQPIVENAIWHGLMKKEGSKNLLIQVENSNSSIKCTIEDNGVGRSSKNGSLKVSLGKSTGISNTIEKIKVFNELYQTQLNMDLIDKRDEKGQLCGFKVVFTIFYD